MTIAMLLRNTMDGAKRAVERGREAGSEKRNAESEGERGACCVLRGA